MTASAAMSVRCSSHLRDQRQILVTNAASHARYQQGNRFSRCSSIGSVCGDAAHAKGALLSRGNECEAPLLSVLVLVGKRRSEWENCCLPLPSRACCGRFRQPPKTEVMAVRP